MPDSPGPPFCSEGNNCFRTGTDPGGNAYIAVAGQEDHHLADTAEALRTLLRDIKAGKADHLLRPRPRTPRPAGAPLPARQGTVPPPPPPPRSKPPHAH